MAKARYEIKYLIRRTDYELLRKRLGVLLPLDTHGDENGYRVSSLYFDDIHHKAYLQKMNGEDDREKFRLRAYNGDDTFIRLECKAKKHGFILKDAALLTRAQYDGILHRDIAFLREADSALLRRFYLKMQAARLAPMVTVAYNRIAFVDPSGARVSFDTDIRAATGRQDLFSPLQRPVSVLNQDVAVMEVKYTHALPAAVRAVLAGTNVQMESISKYVFCVNKLVEVRHCAGIA